MRNLILCTTLLLGLQTAAQETGGPTTKALEGHEYKLTSDVILPECDIHGIPLSNGAKLCPYGGKFSIVDKKDENTFVLVFWDWYSLVALESTKANNTTLDADREMKARRYNYNTDSPGSEKDRYFLITKDQVANYASELHSFLSPTYGAILLPVRYRPQTGLMSKDISIGGTGGVRHELTPGLSLAVMTGLAVTSTTVDSVSTEGRLKKATEQGSATVPLGVMVQWDNVQFAVMTGWDFLFNNDMGWRYQGKPWLSLGIGLSLFTEDTGLKTKTKTN
jgi:hypothetical protein